jgi:predicted Rossmann fold nucleotide-binding protein DprA/Smf involved in DNA uptake
MKLAIIGSRSFNDYKTLCIEADLLKPDMIVSGGAVGADLLARKYANERNLPIIEHVPNYQKYGRRAPLERNKLIIQECDQVLAFRINQSSGTSHAIGLALKSRKPTKVIELKT